MLYQTHLYKLRKIYLQYKTESVAKHIKVNQNLPTIALFQIWTHTL